MPVATAAGKPIEGGTLSTRHTHGPHVDGVDASRAEANAIHNRFEMLPSVLSHPLRLVSTANVSPRDLSNQCSLS